MSKFKWTNVSVAKFSPDSDPVETMEVRARNLALQAIDDGWTGPPFDPLVLAELLKIQTEARGDIPDARTVPISKKEFKLEYNPLRPRGRLRFSIAHEIAHTLFPDCADAVRNRGLSKAAPLDNWQLEVLCNIGAAELLMPLGSFTNLAGETLSIDNVLRLRKEFDVSVEACMIRLVKLSRTPVAAFCASSHGEGKYKLDYVIPAAGWEPPVAAGAIVPSESVIRDVSAIGFTTVGVDKWPGDAHLKVECVGLAPYPGQLNPRVVGLLLPKSAQGFDAGSLRELKGDALKPAKKGGVRIVAHVVPNTNSAWGGAGFASQVRRLYPKVFQDFRGDVAKAGGFPALGSTFLGKLDESTFIVHMVAQAGIGASGGQRLRYAALAQCLTKLRQIADVHQGNVHMPRIGTGHGGASWDIVRELVTSELVDKGIETTVYQRPS